jgi:hypothetical protein
VTWRGQHKWVKGGTLECERRLTFLIKWKLNLFMGEEGAYLMRRGPQPNKIKKKIIKAWRRGAVHLNGYVRVSVGVNG